MNIIIIVHLIGDEMETILEIYILKYKVKVNELSSGSHCRPLMTCYLKLPQIG